MFKRLLTIAAMITTFGIVGVAQAQFGSPQVGGSAADGFVLQSNGFQSTWVATTTLGLDLRIISLATDVSGVLPEANGGTNQSTYSTGDIIYASAANTLSKLAAGADNLVLKLSGGVPTWATDATGGGGGSGLFATNTDSTVIHPVDVTDVLVVGGSATTTDWTNQYLLNVDGGSLLAGTTTVVGQAGGDMTGLNYDLHIWSGDGTSVVKLDETGLLGVATSTLGAIDLSGVLFQKSLITPNSEIQYVIINADDEIQWALPEAGTDKATINASSLLVGTGFTDNANFINCSFHGFWAIGCDTTSTGGDLGVQDDIQAMGDIYIGGGITSSSTLTVATTTATSTLPNLTVTNLFIGGDYINEFAGTHLTETLGTLNVDDNLSSYTDDLTHYVDADVSTYLTTGIGLTEVGGLIDYDTGFSGVLTASSTEWNGFYQTPSSRISAGTGLSWTVNTLNAEVQTSDLHTAVTLSGTPNYITLSGQDIIRAKLDLPDDINTFTEAQLETAVSDDNPLFDGDLGGSVQAWDAELDTLSGLTETTGNVIIAVGSAWASVAQPIIDCTNCTNIPSGASGFTDLGDVTLTSTSTGDIVYNNSSGQWVNLGAGTNGQVLTLASGIPSWAAAGSGGGVWATTTDTNLEVGETILYTDDDVYIGGSASNTAEFNFDVERGLLTLSSTTAATGTIASTNATDALRFTGTTTRGVEFDFGTTADVVVRLIGDALDWVWDSGTNLKLGAVQWNSGDNIDGEVVADNTIDTDSIDWGTGAGQVSISDLPDPSGNGVLINGEVLDFDCSDVTDSGADDGVTCSTEDIVVTLGDDITEPELSINAPTNDYILVASSSATGGWEWVATTSANLGLGVTVSGTPDYITLVGQDIVRAQLDIADDTNATGDEGIDIVANSFTLDLNEITTDTLVAAGDLVAFTDITDSGNQNITFANFEGILSHDALADFTTTEHFLQSAITEVGTIATGVWNGDAITTTHILDDTIAEIDLDAQGALTDEFCLTLETGGGGDFEWQDCGGGGGLWTDAGDRSYLTDVFDTTLIGTTTSPSIGGLVVKATTTDQAIRIYENGAGEYFDMVIDSNGNLGFNTDAGVQRLNLLDANSTQGTLVRGMEITSFSGRTTGGAANAATGIDFEVADSMGFHAGQIEFMTLVEDAIDVLTVNTGGLDIDFIVEATGVADAISVNGADGVVTLGQLTAGIVHSSAAGLLTSSLIVAADVTADTITNAEIDDADQTHTECKWISDPVSDEVLVSLWANKTANNMQITELWCESDGTVPMDLLVDDGTPIGVNGADLSCTSSEAEDLTLGGDTVLAAGEELDFDSGTVSGSPTFVSVCMTYNYID